MSRKRSRVESQAEMEVKVPAKAFLYAVGDALVEGTVVLFLSAEDALRHAGRSGQARVREFQAMRTFCVATEESGDASGEQSCGWMMYDGKAICIPCEEVPRLFRLVDDDKVASRSQLFISHFFTPI